MKQTCRDSLWMGWTVIIMIFVSCQSEPQRDVVDEGLIPQTHFTGIDAQSSGITFNNRVQDTKDFNVLTYRNFYNGGGVAIGDVNNDGLQDIYFTANQEGNRLYLNQGDWTFLDVTESAGVKGTKPWSTGVAFVDINADGWLDIYVCNSGDVTGGNKENELFINQKNADSPTFKEQAADYGLNNRGYSTQAAFFDYDGDGDLDCYLLNNSFQDPSKIELFKSMRDEVDSLGGDKLYRNENGTFVDATREAGIYSSAIGFGLGTAIGDVNQDFLPDIYVSNDFWERDYLYLNQGDGTFDEVLPERIDFCSISSMGGDVADINNDGFADIISTDMLAADNYRLKAMSAFDPYHLENIKYRANYHYQIGQNCLHLNDGEARFQEIAMLAGVASTDWSWGALLFDMNNDGWKDLFVSNGIQRDLMYLDFRDFMASQNMYQRISEGAGANMAELIEKMPANPISNYAFINQRGVHFESVAENLGLAQPSFSNGSAYGDLDNDGDLDLVVNNVNMPAFVYRNEADVSRQRFLRIQFEGPEKNPWGIGAQVQLNHQGSLQKLENIPVRGFQSSMEPYLHFGVGSNQTIEELVVVWPDQKRERLTQVPTNETITLSYRNAREGNDASEDLDPWMKESTTAVLQGDHTHRENIFNDFDQEILLPYMLSTEGPRIISGDLNQDGRQDIILLGAKDDVDKLFLQNESGQLVRVRVPDFEIEINRKYESTCGTLFDQDGDGDLDLVLGAGGNDILNDRSLYTLRFFRNDGSGGLTAVSGNLPPILGNFSTIESGDLDGDGDADLFIGARSVPGNYGLPPRSYLLLNENGQWVDRSPKELAGAGMITDASLIDIDQDQDLDVVMIGDWMSIQIMMNDKGNFLEIVEIPNTSGWWKRIEPADLDGDGDIDFIVGNHGTNTKFQASIAKPLTMVVNDFDQNGKSEFIINWYPPLDNQSYPFATKDELTKQLAPLRKQILEYETYAQQTMSTLFAPDLVENAISYQAEELKSGVLWNERGTYQFEPLPWEAQVAPCFAIAVNDVNEDGRLDLFIGGNQYAVKPQVGRHNASKGVLLIQERNRTFSAISSTVSGIYLNGEVRDAQWLNDQQLLVARNNMPAVLWSKS